MSSLRPHFPIKMGRFVSARDAAKSGIVRKLDTRTKIISAAEAREIAEHNATEWYTGSFDPLLAEHAALLQACAKPEHLLIVEIVDPPQPLLAQRARAELVAGLARVNYVVMSDREAASPDDGITSRFIQHVRHRSNGVKR